MTTCKSFRHRASRSQAHRAVSFSPTNQYYTYTNIGALPLVWSQNTDPASWLNVSTNTGMLAGNTAITNVIVSLAGAATNLGIGNYTASLLVTNKTAQGTVQTLIYPGGQPHRAERLFWHW